MAMMLRVSPNALGIAVARHALIFHAASVSRGDKGYLFAAPSGGGKSTLAAFCDADGIPVLADDGLVVIEKRREFHVRAMPRQAGVLPAALPLGPETRLRAVFFLVKAEALLLQPVSPAQAVARCFRDRLVLGFGKSGPEERGAILDRLTRLFRTVPAYELHFRKDNSFWKAIDALEEKERARA